MEASAVRVDNMQENQQHEEEHKRDVAKRRVGSTCAIARFNIAMSVSAVHFTEPCTWGHSRLTREKTEHRALLQYFLDFHAFKSMYCRHSAIVPLEVVLQHNKKHENINKKKQ
jgi:hypothetical protein